MFPTCIDEWLVNLLSYANWLRYLMILHFTTRLRLPLGYINKPTERRGVRK